MEKKTLAKIRKAVKNVKTENDTFMIEGDIFSCRWDGNGFVWKVGDRIYNNCTVKEVLSFIGNGDYITNYCFDYNNQ